MPKNQGSRSPHQIPQGYADRSRKTDQGVDGGRLLAQLDAYDGWPVSLGGQGDGLLGEVRAESRGADAVAYRLPLDEDPVRRGRGRRHLLTFAGP